MNLLQEHILITTSSFFLIMSTYVTNYLTFFSIILFLTSILKSISNNPSRKYEYMTTSILSIIFFYSGIEIAYNNNYNLFQIKLYFMSLCYFHFMEYIFCLIYHPKKLNFDSFLLNHSKEYIIAITISFIEYFMEYFLFIKLKLNTFCIFIGLILISVGHIFRTGSMFTAKSNFTHLVAYTKKETHILVKKGLYSLSRHPSYFGFFAWTIGTQFILVNPICIIGYAIVTWIFFNNRIREEEIYLITFFGEDYVRYRKRVPILIPCILLYILLMYSHYS